MADGVALSLSYALNNTTFEQIPSLADTASLRELGGCIFWLKAADQTQRHLKYGLSKDAYNHPCLIVDIIPGLTNEVRGVKICIVSEFIPPTLCGC